MVILLILLVFCIKIGIKLLLIGVSVSSYAYKRYKKIKSHLSKETPNKNKGRTVVKTAIKVVGKVSKVTFEAILAMLDTALSILNALLISVLGYVLVVDILLFGMIMGASGWYITTYMDKEDGSIHGYTPVVSIVGGGGSYVDGSTSGGSTGGTSGGSTGGGDTGGVTSGETPSGGGMGGGSGRGDEGGSSEVVTPPSNPPGGSGDKEIQVDVDAGLYTWEDYNYLVALGGESGSYEGFYAVACAVRNRVNGGAGSYRDVVTAPNQFAGYNSSEVGNPRNDNVKNAALAVLRGGDSTVGGSKYFLGRIKGWDMWADSGTEFWNWGGNIFFGTWGKVHNKSSKYDASEGDILIYDSDKGVWKYNSGEHYSP